MREFQVAKGYEDKGVILPTRATKKSAGYDIRTLDSYTLKPGERHVFATGLKVCMEEDEVLLIFPRSSLAVKKGLRLTNSVAVIDADYYSNPENDGHIMISLYNFSSQEVTVNSGDRIAQGIFLKYLTSDDDNATGTRNGGYGSTGTK